MTNKSVEEIIKESRKNTKPFNKKEFVRDAKEVAKTLATEKDIKEWVDGLNKTVKVLKKLTKEEKKDLYAMVNRLQRHLRHVSYIKHLSTEVLMIVRDTVEIELEKRHQDSLMEQVE